MNRTSRDPFNRNPHDEHLPPLTDDDKNAAREYLARHDAEDVAAALGLEEDK